MKKIFKWIKSPSGTISLILIIVIAVLIFYNCMISKIQLSDYSSGLVTEFCGIVVTIIFVQALFDRKNKKDAQMDEKSSIKRFDLIMQLYLNKYKIFFNSVASPFGTIKDNAVHEMSLYFKVKDICDLHMFSPLVPTRSSIELFYDIELILRNYLIDVLRSINFIYNIELQDVLLEFIETSVTYDSRADILSYTRLFDNTLDISDLLKNNGDECYERLISSEIVNQNIMHPYIYLYIMMNKERDIINKYQRIIDSL